MILDARMLDFFDRQVADMIAEKYALEDRKAVRLFLESETYQMLLDKKTEIYMMSPNIVFDLWENEQVTGNPRNSRYIRE